ncbi:MAG: hypothetical protein NT030_01765 [Candidatus Saganbacteria bacterium]|nr:hypothetical protein [Candidatus Saganbacteria bacterium]
MSNVKLFLLSLLVLSVSATGCVFGNLTKGDGVTGSAKYYLHDADKEAGGGYYLTTILSGITDARGRILKEAPPMPAGKSIAQNEDSAWYYYFWNNSEGKEVVAVFDGVKPGELSDVSTTEAIENWKVDSPAAYKKVTGALKEYYEDINLDNVYGISYLFPNIDVLIYSASVKPLANGSKLFGAGKKISADGVPSDHPIWYIALYYYSDIDGKSVKQSYELLCEALVDGATGDLLEFDAGD